MHFVLLACAGHTGRVTTLCVHPKSDALLSAAEDKQVSTYRWGEAEDRLILAAWQTSNSASAGWPGHWFLGGH